MRRKPKGFTLIELLVVIAIIALLISILLPSLSRARELSKRLVCAANIKGIGTSAKIYANDNNEKWMIPPFKQKAINEEGIDYLFDGPGSVGFDRFFTSTSETSQDREAGSTAVSTTRAFWMLVRSGDVTVNQFVCPSSGDDPDETENLNLYYDFEKRANISYGYQVPFGPRSTQPREGADNRQVLSADRGPWYLAGNGVGEGAWGTSAVTGRPGVTLEDSPKAWRQFNSPNHGGRNNGEGQNCLFADGHASFKRTPAVGIDSDNIYTTIENNWGQVGNPNIIHGFTPHDAPTGGTGPYPGQDALGVGPTEYTATDSLIYP